MKFEEAKKFFYALHNGWILYDVENNPNSLAQTENTQYWEKVLLPFLIKQNNTIEHTYERYITLYHALFNDIEDFEAKVKENRNNQLITTKNKHKRNTKLYHNISDNLGIRVTEINQAQKIFLDEVSKVLDDLKTTLKENGVPTIKINRLIDIPLSNSIPLSKTSIQFDIDRIYQPLETPYHKRDSRFYMMWIFNERQYGNVSSTPWFWELFYNDWANRENLINKRNIYKTLEKKYNYNYDKVTEHIAKAFEEFWERYELEQIEKKRNLLALDELSKAKSQKQKKSIFSKWFGDE